MRNLIQFRLVLPALVAAALLGGCASPASREGMTPVTAHAARAIGNSVKVQAGGGADTGAMDSSNISDADLKAVIESALTDSGLFKTVIQQGGSDYELSVRITSLRKPMFGLSLTVEMETAWSLVRVSDRKAVFQKSISSSHTATVSDAVAAVKRLRLAVEGATRDNIAQGIQALSTL